MDQGRQDDMQFWLEWANRVVEGLEHLKDKEKFKETKGIGPFTSDDQWDQRYNTFLEALVVVDESINEVTMAKNKRDKMCQEQEKKDKSERKEPEERLEKEEPKLLKKAMEGKNATTNLEDGQVKNGTCQTVKCLTKGAVDLFLEGAFTIFGNPIKASRDGSEWARNFLREQADTLLQIFGGFLFLIFLNVVFYIYMKGA